MTNRPDRRRSMLAPALFVACAGALATGCASSSSPDFGDEIADVSKEWASAEKKVNRGEDLVKEGRDQAEKGEKQQTSGAREEREAARSLAEAKIEYENYLTLVGGATNADEAKAEAKLLTSYRKAVEKAEDSVKDAQSQQKRGRDNVADGRAKIRKGETMISEGRAELKVLEATYSAISSAER